MSEDCGQAAPAPRPPQSPGPGQSSEVRGPAHSNQVTQHSPTSPQPAPPVVSTTLSPVTSSRSLSPLTRHKGRGRVPGFPQRVTQASASVNNVSEERRDRGHYTVDTQAGVTQSVQSPQEQSANNLSRGPLGRTLFTERGTGHL